MVKFFTFFRGYVLFFILVINNAAIASDIASDITIKGSVRFESKLISKYMQKHGYHFIKEIKHDNNFKTNLFAARDAEVIVKNKDNAVIGVGKTDIKGNYSIPVYKDSSYNILVRFHDREVLNAVSYSDADNVVVDLSYFETDKIDSWFESPALRHCYTCDIRYLETKESMKRPYDTMAGNE